MRTLFFYSGLIILSILSFVVIVLFCKNLNKPEFTADEIKALCRQNLFFEVSTILLLALFLISYYF